MLMDWSGGRGGGKLSTVLRFVWIEATKESNIHLCTLCAQNHFDGASFKPRMENPYNIAKSPPHRPPHPPLTLTQ